jgi:hypothetical protein
MCRNLWWKNYELLHQKTLQLLFNKKIVGEAGGLVLLHVGGGLESCYCKKGKREREKKVSLYGHSEVHLR